jgi:hypothetical protein
MDMLTQRRRVPKLFRIILGIVFLPSLFVLPSLVRHYEKICPAEADAGSGFIYPLNEHGSIAYLTLPQYRKILAARAYLIGGGLSIVALGVWERRKQRNESVSSPVDNK